MLALVNQLLAALNVRFDVRFHIHIYIFKKLSCDMDLDLSLVLVCICVSNGTVINCSIAFSIISSGR